MPGSPPGAGLLHVGYGALQHLPCCQQDNPLAAGLHLVEPWAPYSVRCNPGMIVQLCAFCVWMAALCLVGTLRVGQCCGSTAWDAGAYRTRLLQGGVGRQELHIQLCLSGCSRTPAPCTPTGTCCCVYASTCPVRAMLLTCDVAASWCSRWAHKTAQGCSWWSVVSLSGHTAPHVMRDILETALFHHLHSCALCKPPTLCDACAPPAAASGSTALHGQAQEGRQVLDTCEEPVTVVLACPQVSCTSFSSCCLHLTFMPLMQPILRLRA